MKIRESAINMLDGGFPINGACENLIREYNLEKDNANCKCKHNSIKNKYRRLLEAEIRKTL